MALLGCVLFGSCAYSEVVGSGLGGSTPTGSPHGWAAPPVAPPRAVAAPTGRPAPTANSGPVPDFAPMMAVLTHEQLAAIQPELSAALNDLLGPRHVVERFSGPSLLVLTGLEPPGEPDDSLLWIRDYQPLFVRTADGDLKIVRYLAENPNRARYLPTLGGVREERDGGYLYLPALSRGETAGRWLRTERLPLIHENGNLVSTGTLAFVTELLFEQNAEPLDDAPLRAAGYRARSSREVLQLFAGAVERPVEDVIVMPSMPGEDTGHVDLFLLALDERTVVVPSIADEALDDEMLNEHTRYAAPRAQIFLEERSSQLQALGLTVERLPMLPPMPMTEEPPVESSEEEAEPAMLVLSPTNALLVSVGGARTVLLPRFDMSSFPTAFRRLDRAYRRAWEELFRAYGWVTISVDATQLGLGQGLLRCASFPLPQ